MSIDRLICSLTDLDKKLDELNEHYSRFHEVIENEKFAIESSDLVEIENIVPEKVRLGACIESAINEISSIFQRLAECLAKSYPKFSSEISLTSLTSILNEVSNHSKRQGLDLDVFNHLTKGLTNKISGMQAQHRELYPKIEANKYLVDTLLENHRQTHRFWLGMISESQGTYGAQGVHNKQNLTSMISVKA